MVILMLYVIPDTHLGHRAMCYSCGRPLDFSEQICRNWQEIVEPEDTVIHLGDVAWDARWLHRMMRLPGSKILVRGNHDREPAGYYLNVGFSRVMDRLRLEAFGEPLFFTHEPANPSEGCWNLHGHFHDLHREQAGLYLPLSLEHMGYKPLALSRGFVERLKKWRRKQHHPSVREIMALGQNALGEIRLRDLCGTMPYDVGFTALTFTGADGSLQIPYKHVVYWKAKQGVFFLVLQDFRMPIGKRETGKASMTIHRTENRETVYTCDMSRAVRERQGRYTLFWLPIRQTD